LEILPTTFQDAITITRRLRRDFGVECLWIDALCIFQDSMDDWRTEDAKMSDVYGNAWCNIAATKGADGSSGLFSARNISSIRPLLLYVESGESQQQAMRIPFFGYNTRMWEKIKQSPLNSRGWVFQERTLSRRILHFAKSEIFWECQHLRTSESSLVSKSTSNQPIERMTFIAPTPRSLPLLTTETVRHWAICIRGFTPGALSHPSDKLVAISGLAKKLAVRYQGNTYVAGLWREHIEVQLLWMPLGSVHRRPFEYRAPSWSWASVDGAVVMHNVAEGAKSVSVVLSVNTQLVVENDPFGQVIGGKLWIKGPVWKG
jgi:hypothetical protein